ncbi:transposable element Tc1 transposase [Trichonephila clavipes]|uniref:Transposable element Tc1 transposase n=1 Tax=Trichonephila clavipes TaxID=2585209 RepID=A0A8X6WD13_TRICX|nr:transposable element Tc1 transposase [Trichonephila clavipes]
MLTHAQQGKTSLPPPHFQPFLARSIPRLVTNRAYLGSFRMISWTAYEFGRIRGTFRATLERDIAGHHTGFVFLNIQPDHIMHSCYMWPKTENFGKRNMPGKRARRHFSQLSEFERGLIIGMKTAGWSTRRVAGQVDCLECAVRNCWEQWTREGTHAWKTESGATRKTTRREDRRIVRQALVDPTVTRLTIRVEVGVAIVPQTISRHLAEANLKSKRPFRAIPLTPEHRQLRLQWCQARSMWNVTDWQKVVFSDESRFVLWTDDNRVRVWRHPGERYNSPHSVLRHTARTAGVMVWGP